MSDDDYYGDSRVVVHFGRYYAPTTNRTLREREEAVARRSVKGAVHVKSAEGRGVVSPNGDARKLAREAIARLLGRK